MRATATPFGFRFLRLAMTACLAWSAGCAQFDLKKAIPWKSDDDGDKKPMNRVVAVWSESVLTSTERPPVRGFGGRLMFYPGKGDKPIQVKGTLAVYAFEEENRDPLDFKPDRMFVITPEQLAKHYSKSKVGDSYSVWLPWDEVGGPQKEISLIVRFTAEDGNLTIGEQTKHILSGRPPTEAEVRRKPGPGSLDERKDSSVRQVSYEDGVASEPTGRTGPRMRVHTTTIPVQPQFGRSIPVSEMAPRATSNSATAPTAAARQNPVSLEQLASNSPGSTRSSLGRPRPLGEPIARLERGRAPWQQSPAGSPSRPEPSPEAPNGTESGFPSPSVKSNGN